MRLQSLTFGILFFITMLLGQDTNPFMMNLAGLCDWSAQKVFVDEFLMSRVWTSQHPDSSWGNGGPIDMDSLGWVCSLSDKQTVEALIFTSGRRNFTSERYVCLYEGTGELDFWNVEEIIDRKPGRIVVKTKPRVGMAIVIKATDPSDYIRNIHFVKEDQESVFKTHPFHSSLLTRWKGYYGFRFMDFMQTNNSEVVDWSDRIPLHYSTQAHGNGIALEYMIQLCNTVKIRPWFCMPHMATDDYIRKFAEMVKKDLDPSLEIYIEYSNEVWNSMFKQSGYARDKGKELGLSTNDYQAQLYYFSKRSVEIFKIWEEVFGSTKRLVRVMASHAANAWSSKQVLSFEDAYKHVDALAIAPYFGHAYGSPESQNEVAQWSVEQLLDSLDKLLDYESHDPMKESMAVLKNDFPNADIDLIAYEGGQHLVGHGGAENNEKLTELFIAANRHPRMKDLYLKYLRHWKDMGGKEFAIFSSIGNPSKWGSWGILEYEGQDLTTAPKYQAVLEFAEKNPIWWQGNPIIAGWRTSPSVRNNITITLPNSKTLVIDVSKMVGKRSAPIVVKLYTLSGKLLIQKHLTEDKKNHTFTLSSINGSTFAQGMYLLQLKSGSKSLSGKILLF